MPRNEHLEAVLSFDSVAAAEALMLGAEGILGMAALDNKRREETLNALGDSHYNTNFKDQLAMALAEGFKVVLEDKFKPRDGREDIEETFLILWNPEGFLLTLESYRGDHRNSSHLYYNLDLTDILADSTKRRSTYTSSGGMVYDREEQDENGRTKYTNIWAGDHDGREAFRYNLSKLREANPLPVWKSQPFLWLLNYAETPSYHGEFEYDSAAINAGRIARLPQEVQDAIKGEARYNR